MSLALLFAGQGAQKVGMGRTLHENSAAARALYDQSNSILGWDLAKLSFEGPEAELTQTKVCQPALYVHGMALLAALSEGGKIVWPVDAASPPLAPDASRRIAPPVTGRPEAANMGEKAAGTPLPRFGLGLSLGELTACAAAGVYDFATGLKIVAERGRLMQEACEQTSGGMAAIMGEERAKVNEVCAEFGIEAANFNAPGQIIVSGEKTRVDTAVAAAKERGIRKVIPLNVAGAYHSRLMEPARAAFARYLETIPFAAPRFTVFSNTTGQAVPDAAAVKAALVRQVVSPVLWEDCLRAAAAAGATEFWELGPGGVLAGLARRTDKNWPVKSFSEFADLAAL